jgi:hypothetical protein
MVTPREIREALVAKGSPDGHHRIVYDRTATHVFSEPKQIRDVRPSMIADSIINRVRAEGERTGPRSDVSGPPIPTSRKRKRVVTSAFSPIPTLEKRLPLRLTSIERSSRLAQLRTRSKSEEDAIAAALGLEFWGLGIQLLFAVEQGLEVE